MDDQIFQRDEHGLALMRLINDSRPPMVHVSDLKLPYEDQQQREATCTIRNCSSGHNIG